MERFLRRLCIAGIAIAGVAACGPNDPLTVHSAQAPEALGAVVFPIDGVQGEGAAALGALLAETLRRDGTPAHASTAFNGRNPLVVGRVEETEERGSVTWISIGWYAMAGDGSSLGDFRHELVASADLWRRASPDVLQMIAAEAAPKILALVREPVGALVAEAAAEAKAKAVAQAEAEAQAKAEAEASRASTIASAAPAPPPEPAPAARVAETIQAAPEPEALPAILPGEKGNMMPPPQLAEAITPAAAPISPALPVFNPAPPPAPAAMPEPPAAPVTLVEPALPPEIPATAETQPNLGIAPVGAPAAIRADRGPAGFSTATLPPPSSLVFAGGALLVPAPMAELQAPNVEPAPPPLPPDAPAAAPPAPPVESAKQAVAEKSPAALVVPPPSRALPPPNPVEVAEQPAAPAPPAPPAPPVEAQPAPRPIIPPPVVETIAGAVIPVRQQTTMSSPAASIAAEPRPPAAPPLVPSISVDPVVVELAFWHSVQTSKDPADFDEYLKKYPFGAFSGLAKNRLAQVKAEQERIVLQPPPVLIPPPAPAAVMEPKLAEAQTASPPSPTAEPAPAPSGGLWATPAPAASEPAPATSGGLWAQPAAAPENPARPAPAAQASAAPAPKTAAAPGPRPGAASPAAGRTPPAPAAAPAPPPVPAVPVAPVVKEPPSSFLPAREPAVAPLVPAAPPAQQAQSRPPAAAAADPLPPRTPVHPVRPPVFLIKPVKGAPGDGNLALTRSMRDSLSAKDIAISDDPRQATYVLEGAVRVDPPFAGRQKTRIIWMVTTIEGDQIGSAVQENAVRQGSLDGQWGQVAAIVSEAAVEGIQKLFPTAISRSTTNRSATIAR